MGKWTLTALNCVPYFILTPFLEVKETLAVLTPYWKKKYCQRKLLPILYKWKIKNRQILKFRL